LSPLVDYRAWFEGQLDLSAVGGVLVIYYLVSMLKTMVHRCRKTNDRIQLDTNPRFEVGLVGVRVCGDTRPTNRSKAAVGK
jgi:hypothetical protein